MDNNTIDNLKANYKEMYDLGYKHGYEMAKKDLELEQLEREIDWYTSREDDK